MNKFLPKIILFLCLFIAAMTVLWLPTQADDEPTAVSLISFDAVPLNNAVRLDWETGSELNTLGFRIKRAASGGSAVYLDYVGDNGFIPGVGGVAIGGTYSVTDNRVQNGQVYTYILMEVETSSNETEAGRDTVTVGILPTNTPVVISGPGSSTATAKPGTSAGSTVTATPSANQQATSTPPGGFVTITPNSAQSLTSSVQNSDTTNIAQTTDNTTASDTTRSGEVSSASLGGVSEVFAQAETIETNSNGSLAPQPQNEYPGDEPTATAVPDPYDVDTSNTTVDEAVVDDAVAYETVSTPVPVIGSTDGYSGTQADEPTNINSSGNASANQGRIFLWLGFIVALLIFATGLIGTILLFSRKAN